MRNEVSGWLLRHAQSESNIGKAVEPQAAQLTTLGQKQAAWAANRLNSAFPVDSDQHISKIICSPLIRAQQTCLPLVTLQSEVSKETWEIQEFTNLPTPDPNDNTANKRAQIMAYWENPDPNYAPVGGERFVDLISRVDDFIYQLKTHAPARLLICSHRVFLTATKWRLNASDPKLSITANSMLDFWQYLRKNNWKNAEYCPFSVNSTGMIRIKKGIKPPSFSYN